MPRSSSAPAGAVRYSGYPLPVGALGFASLPTGYCPLRLPAPHGPTVSESATPTMSQVKPRVSQCETTVSQCETDGVAA
jgi:hypothetical protein